MADLSVPLAEMAVNATSEFLDGIPDWGLNLDIADRLKRQPQKAAIVLHTLKKRLSHKNHRVGLLAIILLESLVKNAPRAVLPLVASESYLDELVRVLPKQVRDPHNRSFLSSALSLDRARDISAVERWDRILLAIESWARAFGDGRNPDIGANGVVFANTLRALQRAGVKFPAPERDEMAPVVTPAPNAALAARQKQQQTREREEMERRQREVDQSQGAQPIRSVAHDTPPRAAAAPAAAPAPAAPSVNFSDAECASAAETARLLLETLEALDAGSDVRQNELVQMLAATLKPMVDKIASRLNATLSSASPNERLLEQLLAANDLLQTAQGAYDRALRGELPRRRVSDPVPPARSASSAAPHEPYVPVFPQRATGSSSSSRSPSRTRSGEKHREKEKEKERKKPIPLLQPPPGASPSRKRSSVKDDGAHVAAAAAAVANSSSSRSSSAASSPALRSKQTAPQAAPELDLLSFAPSPEPSAAQPQRQPAPTPAQQQPPSSAAFFAPPPPVAPHASPFMSQAQPMYPSQMQMYASQPPAAMQMQAAGSVYPMHVAQAARPPASAFALPPPPAPTANGAFWPHYAAAGSTPAPSPAAARTPASAAPSPASSAVATPFDEIDPFAALASRQSPARMSAAPSPAATASTPYASPAASRTQQQPQQPPSEQYPKSSSNSQQDLINQFDLLMR